MMGELQSHGYSYPFHLFGLGPIEIRFNCGFLLFCIVYFLRI